jgi:hypothetical protein
MRTLGIYAKDIFDADAKAATRLDPARRRRTPN